MSRPTERLFPSVSRVRAGERNWQSHQDEAEAMVAVLRLLLRATTPEDVVRAVVGFVRELGGDVVSASAAPPDALPLDIGFGVGDPVLPVAVGEVSERLLQLLPSLVEDARAVVARTHREVYLEASATIDSLTGLTNRRLTMRVVGRLGVGDTVVALDLDHFKAVNDTFGHERGDEVLRTFGSSLQSVARAADTVGRIGGEEFLWLLPTCTAEGALEAIERLRANWATSRPMPVTFSAGVCAIHADGGREAMRRADGALYDAKDAGRDRAEVAS